LSTNDKTNESTKDHTGQLSAKEIEESKKALLKLPILGPALWLYARDSVRKYMFVGDIDWMLLPPVVLDQCRLYNKADLPFAFVTWAFVDDSVDARLRSHHPKIAPHEWNSGEHVWLIDVVTPFGHMEETVKDLHNLMFPDKTVHALLPDANDKGHLRIHEWAPVSVKSNNH